MPTSSKGFGELFGEAKEGLNHLQKGMASILPAFPGMPAGKYFDLAIGVDFEETIMPPCPVFPVPHVGMVFDIFASILSAIASALPPPPEEGGGVLGVAGRLLNAIKPSVKVHGRYINNAGTPVLHLPAMFLHLVPFAVPTSSSEMWMGSSTVLADGGPFSTQFHPSLSCNLVGFPTIPRINKTPKPSIDLLMPTALLLAIISSGKPVLVGGPPTIDLFQMMVNFGLKGLLKKVKFKKLEQLAEKFQKKIDDIAKKNPKLAAALQKIKCKHFGEPVDAATGRVYHTNLDFELPGPIPLQWERTYYSDAEVMGPLGSNWHHSYNMGLYDAGNGFALRLQDGREAAMPYLSIGEVFHHRIEQLFFERDDEGYFITDASKLVYRFMTVKTTDELSPLASIINPQGSKILFHYTKGILTGITDSCNRNITVETDAMNRVADVHVEADGKTIHLIQYRYDAAGNMIQTEGVAGDIKHFYYDGHLLVKLTNQSGMSFYWEYEGKGDDAKCIHTWGDEGVLEYWTQYEEGYTITRNSLGHTTEYFYDQKKLIYKIVDANGGITRQSYNQYQELEVAVNPEGGTVQYRYNTYGKITRIINENDESSSYNYDERLNLIQANSPGGRSISWKYDEQNRLVQRRNASGNMVGYEYEGSHLKKITNDKSWDFILHYSTQNDLIRLVYPNGLEEQWEYDEMGNVTAYTDVRGNTTLNKYDSAGRLIQSKEPDGNAHHFTYDVAGNVIKASDDSHQVSFEYGALGILRRREQNNHTVHFNYDTELQLRSIVNEGGEVYKFRLDALGNVVSEWGFDGLNRRYLRDGNGRVTKVLRPAEKWTLYDYDSVGKIVREEHSDGSLAAYKYDADGMLTEAFNEVSHIKLQRDKAGRVVKDIQGDYSVTKHYDRDGNCIHTGSSLGADIQNAFDEWGTLQHIKVHAGDEIWEAGMLRDQTGLELHRQLSGGVSVQLERDKLGRVIRRSIGAKNIEQNRSRYEWGKGNKLNRIVNELAKASVDFKYDESDNLISAAYSDKKETETIYRVPDKIGNLFKTKDRSDRKYGKGGQLLEDDKYTYYYDAEGNLVFKEFRSNANYSAADKSAYAKEKNIPLSRSRTGWAYEWASNGMLEKVITPNNSEVAFAYDPLGRRIAKQHKGSVTRFVWDGNVPLHEWKYRGVFPPQNRVDDKGEIVETKEPVGGVVTWVFEDGGFVACAKLEGEKKYSVVADYLGTPTHAYDAEGKKVWERELDIYGETRIQKGKESFIPYLYQGQYADEETGLAYNRFRYYDNESGNYISQDPIKLWGGERLYCYVANSNNQIDRVGLTPLNEGGYSVYGLFDKGATDPYYIGISNDPVRREMEHMETGRMTDNSEIRVLNNDLKYREARGQEQNLIEKYNTKTGVIGEDVSEINRGNKVNSFDKSRTDIRGKAFREEYEKAKAKDKANVSTHH